jgi:hypothetical protein
MNLHVFHRPHSELWPMLRWIAACAVLMLIAGVLAYSLTWQMAGAV